MGTVILLTLMATSLAFSIYFLWRAFSALPKQPSPDQTHQSSQVDGDVFESQRSA